MQYVRFGNSGMTTSRFCLGAMTFGSRMDEQTSQRVLDEAIDHGVNFLDTADSYGDSEEVIGRILPPEKREKIYVATKVFRQFCRGKKVGRNSRVNIINSLERSLRLMKTNYVDLYQLHHPDDQTPLSETISTLDNLVRQGKIRYFGVSNHYAWQMACMLGESAAHHWEPIISLQANYNILDRQIEMESVPFCRRFNIAIMCYGPLCGGILTGKYSGPDDIPEGSRAQDNKAMQKYLRDETVQQVLERLQEELSASGRKMNQLAWLWLMARPQATVVILGGSKPEHFRDAYEIADDEMPEDLVKQIDRWSAPRVYARFMNQPIRDGAALTPQV